MVCKRRIALIFFFILLLAECFAQSKRKSLTTLLREFSSSQQVVVSFSPTLTDGIYPINNSIKGTPSSVLTSLLDGSNLLFRQTRKGFYYIYPNPKKAIALSSQVDRRSPASVLVAPKFPPIKEDEILLPPLKISYSEIPVVDSLLLKPFTSVASYDRNATKVMVRTNLLCALTATLNLGVEIGLTDRWALGMSLNYNPLKFKNNIRFRHFLVQPEVRYWLNQNGVGSFVGMHAYYGLYNIGALPNLPLISNNMQHYRYQGNLYGAGISFGYSWTLSRRWHLEGVLGVGYAHLYYKKFPCFTCGSVLKKNHKNYFGPTKLALNLVYVIK